MRRGAAGASAWLRAAALLTAAALAAAQQQAAASWHPHRLRQPAVGLRHSAEATAPALSSAAAATPVPAPGSRKPRVGVAPPGVALEQALASARALQPELFGALPEEFLAEYKNPCWHPANATYGKAMLCLPLYYILGDFQCGVRDLAHRILMARHAATCGVWGEDAADAHHALNPQHPDVLPAHNSAPHWWDENKPWEQYHPLFDGAARAVVDAPQRVVGDTSTATFAFTWTGSGRTNKPWSKAMMHCREETCKQDNKCIASRCYDIASTAWHPVRGDGSALDTPHLMRLAMGASVRLIVLLRDPVERFHAAFWAHDHYRSKYGATEAGFAEFARYSLAEFGKCANKEGSNRTRDECVLAYEAWGQREEDTFYHCDQLLKSVYSVYMRSWLHAFPGGELLVLRLEDYVRPGGVAAALDAVQRHLGLEPPDAAVAGAMLSAAATRATPPRERFPDRAPPEAIDPAVRASLRAFFDPFDRELEQLLGRPGFADWHSDKSFLDPRFLQH